MRKNAFTLILAAITLIAAIGCGLFKTKPASPASELADKTAAPFTSIEVRLNNETAGSTSDLTKLRETIRDIMRLREENGVFRIGSNKVENNVYVLVGGQVPAISLASIALAINENGGEAHVPLPSAMRPNESATARPNPLTLVATAGANVENDITLWDVEPSDTKYSIVPTFEITDNELTILLTRAYGNIEISADGKYYVNDPADLEKTSGPEDVKILQRLVSEGDIKAAGEKLMAASINRSEVTVFVSESAPTDSLLRLFPLLEGTNVQWRVVIRRPVKKID
jgi:hypothetical protein